VSRIETKSRARSVFPNEPAPEFMEWLIRIWNGLTPEEQASARMEARPAGDMVMVGLVYEGPAVSRAEREKDTNA
jgi:hypothetical protein